jgi:hypothetical protein
MNDRTDILCPSCTGIFDLDSAELASSLDLSGLRHGIYCPHCGAFVSDAEIEAQSE